MVSATTRAEAVSPLASLASSPTSSSSSANSFAQQLATTVEGYFNQANSGSSVNINVSEVAGRNSGGSQFLVTVTPGGSSAGAPTTNRSTPTSPAAPTAPTPAPSSDVPTMLGMGPVAGTAPVQQVIHSQPAAVAPVTEGDAYWDAQPTAVQALRDMPEGDAKNKMALNLANQGYSIDTQIMVWGWDPQMTMTVRANQGYSWVPSYGQANIPIGPGLSMPGNPNTYNPGNPPAGAIQVSTAFAAGTIQNPLVQTESSST
jgi:hypothetical protein